MERDVRFFEKLNSYEKLEYSLNVSRQAIDLALEKLGPSTRYSHLPNIIDPSRIHIIGAERMRTYARAKTGREFGRSFYSVNGDDAFGRDVVVLSESVVGPHGVLHEFVHRASYIKQLRKEVKSSNYDNFKKTLPTTGMAGNTLSGGERREIYRARRNFIPFSEGVTDWAVIYLLNQMPEYRKWRIVSGYLYETNSADTILKDEFARRGFVKSEAEIFMLDAALTGDFLPLKTLLDSPLPNGEKGMNLAEVVNGVKEKSEFLYRMTGK